MNIDECLEHKTKVDAARVEFNALFAPVQNDSTFPPDVKAHYEQIFWNLFLKSKGLK